MGNQTCVDSKVSLACIEILLNQSLLNRDTTVVDYYYYYHYYYLNIYTQREAHTLLLLWSFGERFL